MYSICISTLYIYKYKTYKTIYNTPEKDIIYHYFGWILLFYLKRTINVYKYPQMVVHQIGENPNSIGNFNGKMRRSIIKCGSSPIYILYIYI